MILYGIFDGYQMQETYIYMVLLNREPSEAKPGDKDGKVRFSIANFINDCTGRRGSLGSCSDRPFGDQIARIGDFEGEVNGAACQPGRESIQSRRHAANIAARRVKEILVE